MTTPAFIYSFLVATFLGSAFHFLKGGGGGRFVLLLILSWAGFIVGHLLGSIWGIDFLMIGPVSGGFGLGPVPLYRISKLYRLCLQQY